MGSSLSKKRAVLLLVISGFLILTTIGAVVFGMMQNRGEFSGCGTFRMFTTDSNILSGLVAVLTLSFALCRLCGWTGEIPRWVLLLDLAASSGVMLTFVIAAGFLGPMMGPYYFGIFAQETFFLHLLNPLLAAVLLIFLLPSHRLTARHALIGLIPTVLYSAVYTYEILSGGWHDFYGFTLGGHYELTPIILIIMYGLTYLIAFVLTRLHNAVVKRQERKA